jgi:hypothetical protein
MYIYIYDYVYIYIYIYDDICIYLTGYFMGDIWKYLEYL